MPVEKIGAMVQEKSPKALYHVDAIQAFGKYRIYPKKWGIHLLSVSGHKIHGPKGVGFLYINSKAKVQPLIDALELFETRAAALAGEETLAALTDQMEIYNRALEQALAESEGAAAGGTQTS